MSTLAAVVEFQYGAQVPDRGTPMMRALDIPHDDVVSTNVSNVVRVFAEIAGRPEDAKKVRGAIFLAFSSYDPDPRPNWLIPEIRAFIQKVDSALPYFAYFLVGDPALGLVLMYLLCLIPVDTETGQYSAEDLLTTMHRKAADVASFCARIGDNADRATDSLLLNLPASLAKADPELAKRILKAMRLVLVGLETSVAAGNTPDAAVKPEVDGVLDKACTLASIDRSAYRSDLELIRALLARITPPVAKDVFERFEVGFDGCLERIPGRKLKADMDKLRSLVRDQEAAAYRFVEVHIRMAAGQPGYLQPAAIVAVAILEEWGDRSALLQVERRAEELDVPPETWAPTQG
jgi:hypothetical protein